MKEDKLDKQIAASLKKHLGEASVPYELGAWEGFQKKRGQRKYKGIAIWASSIAASIALLLIVANAIDLKESEDNPATQLATKTQPATEKALSTKEGSTVPLKDSLGVIPEALATEPLVSSGKKDSKVDQRGDPKTNNPIFPTDKRVSDPVEVPLGDLRKETVDSEQLAVERPNVEKQKIDPEIGKSVPVENLVPSKNAAESVTEEKAVAIPNEEEIEQKVLPQEQVIERIIAEADPVEKGKSPLVQDPQTMVREADFPEIPKTKTAVNLGMGISPGFGIMQAENTVTSAASIGVGVLVDVDLPGKIVLGSGLGVNYLNQVNEMEGMTMAYGNSYPQTDKIEVRQMQLEIPVFVKYPVTRNNSVSIQAGFSNFYSLNQKADQKSEYTAQVPMFSDALGSSSFSIVKQNMQETTPLETNDGKFYPFATLNLGVNLRVLETSGANYYIMPFYNYQVRQISGYGNTYGLFGASFKMNFGGGGK